MKTKGGKHGLIVIYSKLRHHCIERKTLGYIHDLTAVY